MSHRSEQFRKILAGVDHRCQCPSATDVARAGIAGTETPLCPVHDSDELAQRIVADEVAAIEARSSPLSEALANVVQSDRLRAVAELCSCRPMSTKDRVRQVLEGRPPPPACQIHDTSPAGSTMALNGDPLEAGLRQKLGLPPINPNPDGSFDDAA